MPEPPIEFLAAAAMIAVLVALVEFVSGGMNPPIRGWISIFIGTALIAAGVVIAITPSIQLTPATEPGGREFLARDICFFGGVIFLGAGLVRRLSRTDRRVNLQRVGATLAEATREMKEAQELLTSVVESSISGIMILQAMRDEAGIIVDFDIRRMNKEAERLLGVASSVLKSDGLLEHLPCLKTERLFESGIGVITTRLPFREERCIQQGGRDVWFQIAVARHGDGLVVNFADISDRKQVEDRLRYAAQHDTLTGTPNRSLFTERLEQAIKRARRQSGYKFAVLFIDIDRFKFINDSLGHEAGDQLLISISDRLKSNLRNVDSHARVGEGQHMPARLGGDEFAVLLDGIKDLDDATAVGDRIQTALSQPHKLAGQEINTTISVGIVTSEGNYERPDEILRDADAAMYQAKRLGKARNVVFDETMHNEALERMKLEKQLRHAAEHDEFKLVYQAIVALKTGRLVGFEALLRWTHPDRDIVLPADFIGMAEELDLIVPIGRWVLTEAAQQLAVWRRYQDDLTMSVNISKQQLTQIDLLEFLDSVLRDTSIEPSSLLLEITETTIMQNAERIVPVLEELRGTGVRLAMDDFGTGQSSLSFLHSVPVDVLKIDQGFVKSAPTKRDAAAIARTIIQLAQNLDMDAIAEGVETRQQLEFLTRNECPYGQGFLFSEPMSPERCEESLRQGATFPKAA